MKISDNVIESSGKLIKEAKNILITNHVNPDGDAIGAAMGLKSILASIGKDVQVVVPNDYPTFLKWMKGSHEVLFFNNQPELAKEVVAKADLIFHLDYNSLKRSGPMQEVLEKAAAKRIVIDHHQQPDDFAEILISEPTLSSTCEMVYHFAAALGWESNIDRAAGECLYTGIITDTGNFRFSGTSPETHRVAASLLQLGVKPHEVASRVYDNNSVNRLGLLSRTLDRMEVLPAFHTAIMSLSAEDLRNYNYQRGDTEGFVNYGLSVEGIKMSVFVVDKDGQVKMSFRSKGEFDVNKLARKHFNGGGHLNAAGALSDKDFEGTLSKLKEIVKEYENELQNAV